MPREKKTKLHPELFEVPYEWERLWTGMPEFIQGSQTSSGAITVHFRTPTDKRAFLEMLGEKRDRRQAIWYPRMKPEKLSRRGAQGEPQEPGKYPIYIISKGRWKNPLTVRALRKLSLPYYLVVEPQERRKYRKLADSPNRLLVLPFSNLGKGSIPARNWVWEHSIEEGHERHWILDDNIDGFYRYNRNLKYRITDESPFAPVEEFTDRFENVGMSGMNYEFFIQRRKEYPPFYLNTRIYSCILLDNRITHRWRGIYNEDTDLSLRILKDGMCTVLFNSHLAKKVTTMTMKGGNTDELYKQDAEMDGRRLMAESLREQHPDVVTITHKWGRWHHQVDYRPFKRNRLEEKKNED